MVIVIIMWRQVSEDHCWINMGADASREASVEVTTDTAAKRGLAPSEEAWRGWLYNGGHAVLCTPKVCCTDRMSHCDCTHPQLLGNCVVKVCTRAIDACLPVANHSLQCREAAAKYAIRVQMAVTALVASLNPAIIARQNTGVDSEEVTDSYCNC